MVIAALHATSPTTNSAAFFRSQLPTATGSIPTSSTGVSGPSPTTTAAGLTKSGLETTLQGLQRLDREDPVLLYHFSGPERVFTVFIREADRSLVGCVRVERSARS